MIAMPDNRRWLSDLGVELPIVQAPMAGAGTPELAAAVSAAGGLGSLGCAMLTAEQIDASVGTIRRLTNRAFNLNFFCHSEPGSDPARARQWLDRLAPYYRDLGIVPPAGLVPGRQAFNDELCDLVVRLRPPVVSFHFGLPRADLVDRVRGAGCRVLSSATTPGEAAHLDAAGVDAIIAQGTEAGGHNGNFAGAGLAAAFGTMALVPQVVDRVSVPVIAAGGIADGRGIAAALMLGATAAQIGTAYLFCPEASISRLHRAALGDARNRVTAHTNVFTGRPARGFINRLIREVGPIAADAPDFPLPGSASTPLRQAAEAKGIEDFVPLWGGQAAALGRSMPAGELTRMRAGEAKARLAAIRPEF
jgi:nitronate monooxygenase